MSSDTNLLSFPACYHRWFKVLFLCIAVVLTNSCNGKPSVIKSFRIKSPDGKWEIVVERLDNGMGFGLGALYDEVHLVESGKSISQHGDPCSNVLFYRDSSEETEITTQVTWIDSKHIQIKHPAYPKPGRSLAEYHSFSVNLIPVPATTK